MQSALLVLGALPPPAACAHVLARLHRPRAYWAWYLFAIGQFMFAMGDAYTYIYPRVFGADVPFPSPGDAIYLSLYPALFAGRTNVREKDVVETAAKVRAAAGGATEDPRGPSRLEALGPVQRRTARVMEQSVASIPASYLERSIDLFCENLERFRRGDPLRNVVDPAAGY